MPRRLRWIPEGATVAVSTRTLQGRHFLRPGRAENEILLGVLGYALERHAVRLHAVTVLSNHYHLLLTPSDADELARFMNLVNSKLAREFCRLRGWSGHLWSDRYTAILVSAEEAAQVQQLRYVLGQGCKEGLVARPADWQGVQSASTLCSGDELDGWWFDRSAEGEARRRGQRPGRYDHATRYAVELTPIPVWAHLSEEAYRQRVCELVAAIEEETATMHRQGRTRPAGSKAVRRKNPLAVAAAPARRARPLVHAVSRKVRESYRAAYREFVLCFRGAALHARTESRAAHSLRRLFPEGSFPPRLPFVGREMLRGEREGPERLPPRGDRPIVD